MIRKSKFTAIEDIMDIFDYNRVWYYIPGFNGYEVSNDNIIRSMKHYVKYPYGILIKPVKKEPYGSSPDPLYELSDNNNERKRIRLSQIIHLAMSNQFAVAGYPRATIITDGSSRNKFVKNQNGAYVKVYNGPKAGGGRKSFSIPPIDNVNTFYPKFTITQDGSEMPNMEYKQPEVKCPVRSIDGSEYYGRRDCRCVCNIDIPVDEPYISINIKGDM